MSKYSHVVQYMMRVPWALDPLVLAVMVDLIDFRSAGGKLSDDEIRTRISAAGIAVGDTEPQAREIRAVGRRSGSQGNTIAVVPISGVISHRASMFSKVSGMTSIEGIRSNFREAMGSSNVNAVILDVDSPGGSVEGVPEMAAEIRNARGKGKTIVAHVNATAGSAAYWLASQADEIVSTPSGRAGSIGVYVVHDDKSKTLADRGINRTLISAGKYKTEGHEWAPLSEDAKRYIAGEVGSIYSMFINDVAMGRGTSAAEVRNGYGEGRALIADKAKAVGLVDSIGTIDDVVAGISNGTIGRRNSRRMAARDPRELALI